MTFKNPKSSASFLIGIGFGFLVFQAPAWRCWRLERFISTPHLTVLCPVEDLRRPAGMVC